MTTTIVPNLSFGPKHSSLPPAGELLLITDHLNSSAEFLLHRILATHLKEVKESQAIVLSFAMEFAQWKAIAAKSNVNLPQHQGTGSLIFIDGLTSSEDDFKMPPDDTPLHLQSPSLFQSSGNGVRSLFLRLSLVLRRWENLPRDQDATQSSAARRTIILDDISVLEMIGVPTVELTRFVRILRAACRAHAASLVVRAHALPTSEGSVPFDSVLLRALVDSCHSHVEVRPLASGRSGAVSGEVAVHRGGLAPGENFAAAGRDTTMQYRLSDGGVTFFQRGMGASVL